MKRIFLSLLIVLSVGLSFSPIIVSANTREARVISSEERDLTRSIDPSRPPVWSNYFNRAYTTLWVTNGYTRSGTTTSVRSVAVFTDRYTYRYSYRVY